MRSIRGYVGSLLTKLKDVHAKTYCWLWNQFFLALSFAAAPFSAKISVITNNISVCGFLLYMPFKDHEVADSNEELREKIDDLASYLGKGEQTKQFLPYLRNIPFPFWNNFELKLSIPISGAWIGISPYVDFNVFVPVPFL